MRIPKLAIAVLACFSALGQVSGPVAGYLFDGAALRPIAGVPGGATLGDAMDLGRAANAVAVSPQLDSAIVTASDGMLHLYRLSGKSAAEVAWSGVPSWPARVVYSPSGTAAAIYGYGRAQVFGGLPNSPQLVFVAELGPSSRPVSKFNSGGPQAMAVSDDAAWLIVASEGRVHLVGASFSGSVLAVAAGPRVGVAFAPGGHAAAILNGAGPWLDVFPDVSASSQRIAAPGLAEPVGLAFSGDGKFVVAASRTANSVTIFDLAAGAATTLDCSCTPSGVARMGNLFRLTDAGSGPVWMVDMNATPARSVFVPARAMP